MYFSHTCVFFTEGQDRSLIDLIFKIWKNFREHMSIGYPDLGIPKLVPYHMKGIILDENSKEYPIPKALQW